MYVLAKAAGFCVCVCVCHSHIQICVLRDILREETATLISKTESY